MGHTSFSAYNFIYTTCIDILSGFPIEIETLLREMQPAELGQIPEHPQERCYDLFFLQLGEQFSPVLSSSFCEELLITAANPYLEGKNDIRLLEMFEAAHSMFLAVLVAPQCNQLSFKYLSSYLSTLFQVRFCNIHRDLTLRTELGLPAYFISAATPYGCTNPCSG